MQSCLRTLEWALFGVGVQSWWSLQGKEDIQKVSHSKMRGREACPNEECFSKDKALKVKGASTAATFIPREAFYSEAGIVCFMDTSFSSE